MPLPYLLYRVNARFQEEIRGLKDIRETLSPTAAQPPSPYTAESRTADPTSPTRALGDKANPLHRLQTRLSGSSRLSLSSKLSTPLGVRARLNSLTNNAPRPKKPIISSSTLTLQASQKGNHRRTSSPFCASDDEGGSSSSDEEHARKEEEAERAAEEQDTLTRRLEELQRMMTNETIGLVSTARPRRRSLDRGRHGLGALSPMSVGSSNHSSLGYRPDRAYSDSRSGSQSVSDTGSPQGSIPEIPSPAGGSQPQSPRGRYPNGATNLNGHNLGTGTASPRWTNGQRNFVRSDSSHGGSETSSFTDLSDASLSQSALESALMSNIRGGGGSRLSQFVPSSRIIGSRTNRLPR